ncbi:spermidine synthase [Rhodoferax sp.]|uniref:spermidine synthase n=1 Tax=Rhodoferax sp. TaxID=50421 RepID=UPI0025EBCE34|nr:spermidine synthase [Rhodoferax sp.]
MARKSVASATSALPEVNFCDYGDVRTLHLGTEWVQGSMLLDTPYEIELEYVQRMMAWLLFVPPSSVAKRHAMQLGLGAAALTKFCRKKLRMNTTAVELNPQVVSACRFWFKLPPDDERLHIVLGDAALKIQNTDWAGTVDALQVDLYDEDAAAPVLDSADFYADCRKLLTEEGCMTVNLFGESSSYPASVEKITAAFGADAVWAFKPTREGNTVVLAQRNPTRPTREALVERADVIQTRWGLPAAKWLKVFKPVVA